MSLKSKRIVFWGTYDKGKPRVRLLLAGARAMGLKVIECHSDIWKGVEDKSQISRIKDRVKRILSLLLSYPSLVYRYLKLPSHDIVVISYMGQIDILVIWLFARLRKVPICWDVFLSLYDTVVIDRKIVPKKSMAALLLYSLEWLASRAANQLFMDTRTHAEYFKKLYHLPTHNVSHVYVGAESNIFNKKRIDQKPKELFKVLFYGQFIPLHGIDVIVRAAEILEKSAEDILWIIIGKGQKRPEIDSLIEKIGIKSIRRVSWVRYEQLIDYISESDICLGIFGDSGKATRVIPNKIYQILSVGKPLITGNTPAIRELFKEGPILRLVKPGSPEALASAVLHMRETLGEFNHAYTHINELPKIDHTEVGKQFVHVLKMIDRYVN